MSLSYGNKDMILYNNQFLEGADIYCVDTESTLENPIGLIQNVTMDGGSFAYTENENTTFTLHFVRKIDGEIAEIDNTFMITRINKIFFSNEGEIGELQLGRYFRYYVIPTSGSVKRYSQRIGEFSIEFQLVSPYKYSCVNKIQMAILNNAKMENYCIPNQGLDGCYLDLKIICKSSGSIKFTNKNNGLSISILDCKVGEEIYIDSENIDTGINMDRVTGSIKDVLVLVNGDNYFDLEVTGSAELWCYYQPYFNIG